MILGFIYCIILPITLNKSYLGILNLDMICSPAFIPSTAAEIIPPANPAPSPVGYRPSTFTLSKVDVLLILTGADVLVSIPVKTASSLAYPFIFLSKFSIPSLSASITYDGRQFFNSLNSYPAV